MDKNITSVPNDTVAIICTIHDNGNNMFIINPKEVALGHIDTKGAFGDGVIYLDRAEDRRFISEDGSINVPSLESFKNIDDKNQKLFYGFAVSIDELKKSYDNTDNIEMLMFRYFKDVATNLLMLLKYDGKINIYASSYKSVSPEISGDILKKYEKVSETEKVKLLDFNPKAPTLYNKNKLKVVDILGLENYLKERILGNDDLLEDISTCIAANSVATSHKDIKSMLSVGPTGTGKTETYRLVAEYLDIPLTVYDCNTLTAAGYVGRNIEDILKMAYINSKKDIKVAERSIVVLDEIDKLADRGSDVKDTDVQYGLLKFLDGYAYDVELSKHGGHIKFDTSFLTVAALGAFPGIYESKVAKNSFGFRSEEMTNNKASTIIDTEDYVKFGMIKELMGRFSGIYYYKEQDKDSLKRILLESKNSPLARKVEWYKETFNTDLSWEDGFIDEIVEQAFKLNTGGRSLGSIVDKALLKVERELLIELSKSTTKSHKLVLTKDTATNYKSFKM